MTDRPIREYVSSLALALFLALLVWLVANENARPMRNRSPFPAPPEPGLAIRFLSVPPGWMVYGSSPRTVRLSLRGLEEGLQTLSADRFEAVADVGHAGVQEGSFAAPVEVRCGTACRRQGIRIVGVAPDTVTVSLARAITRALSVDVTPESALPAFYRLAIESVEPHVVQLVGARPAMAEVRSAAVRIGTLATVDEPVRLEGVAVVAVDESGGTVADVVAVPATVDVIVTLRRQGIPMTVYPDLRGMDAVAEGYVLYGFETEPDVVELVGASELLQAVQDEGRVTTAPVDMTGASGLLQKRVALELPEGVTALNAPEGVTVTVEVEPLPGTSTVDVVLRVRGLASGMGATVTPDRVRVLLSGPRPELDRTTEGDVAAYVDVSGLGAGTHRIRVRIDAPASLRARSTTPEEVEVTLRALSASSTGGGTR